LTLTFCVVHVLKVSKRAIYYLDYIEFNSKKIGALRIHF